MDKRGQAQQGHSGNARFRHRPDAGQSQTRSCCSRDSLRPRQCRSGIDQGPGPEHPWPAWEAEPPPPPPSHESEATRWRAACLRLERVIIHAIERQPPSRRLKLTSPAGEPTEIDCRPACHRPCPAHLPPSIWMLEEVVRRCLDPVGIERADCARISEDFRPLSRSAQPGRTDPQCPPCPSRQADAKPEPVPIPEEARPSPSNGAPCDPSGAPAEQAARPAALLAEGGVSLFTLGTMRAVVFRPSMERCWPPLRRGINQSRKRHPPNGPPGPTLGEGDCAKLGAPPRPAVITSKILAWCGLIERPPSSAGLPQAPGWSGSTTWRCHCSNRPSIVGLA